MLGQEMMVGVLADQDIVSIARYHALFKQDLLHFKDIVTHSIALYLDLRSQGQHLPMGEK